MVLRARMLPILVFCGCADPSVGTDDPLRGLVSIAVTPADQTLAIEGDKPATAMYQATGTFSDGHTADLTEQAVFSSGDVTLGGFSGARFTSMLGRGGRTMVFASVGGVAGHTMLTLVIKRRETDPGSANVPAQPEGVFAGPANPARAPELLYPNDGVLLPPNLRKLEFHFLPGTRNTLFEVSFGNAFTDVKVYLRCTPLGNGCVYLPDDTLWTRILATDRGGEAVHVTVRGTDDTGSAVGTAKSIDILFAQEDIRGGIYFWTAGKIGSTSIMRYDFGSSSGKPPERFVDEQQTQGGCVGCHALSPDGRKMVLPTGNPWTRMLLLDVERRLPLVPFGTPAPSFFSSFNPDGSRYVGVYNDPGTRDYNLQIFDGVTGAYVSSIDVGANRDQPLTQPDWSPDGQRIVYARVGIPGGKALHHRGSIEIIGQVGGTWSPPTVLVPSKAGENRYFPSFAPDGDLIAYNNSVCSGKLAEAGDEDCDTYQDPTATIHVVRRQGMSTPVLLGRACGPGRSDNGATALSNSMPRWSPFIFRGVSEFGGRLEWITFSSTRRYGLHPKPVSPTALDVAIIWMAAVDPDKALRGEDPSYPAFALPFQDITTSNHSAQWTREVVGIQ